VTLGGQIDPPSAAETVDVEDPSGASVAQATTDANGDYQTTIAPDATITLHAVWGSVASADVTIRVRAIVRVRLAPVRLFDRTVARGRVRPAVSGARVLVELVHAGRVVAKHRPAMGAAGRFRTRFGIRLPGSYRVVAEFSDAGHLRGTDRAGPRETPLPSLRIGSHGVFVRLLERRLVALRYRLVGIDERYDFRTGDAVIAFRKVQRMTRTTGVDAAVWRALARPIRPRPRSATKGFHIEVDQTRQVLYTVKGGRVTHIIHVSSGKPSTPTHDGTFWVSRKIAGFSPHDLYYPSYFDGNRAIHGWPDVPSYAASHGCVRVPYWHARWIFRLATLGARVLIYH
jgi:hypothetical protein